MTLARRVIRFTPILSILLAVGCEDHPPANADLSTPKSAALVYLKAIQRGDAITARKVSVGTPDEKKWVDALAIMVDGMRSFDNALYGKFGRYSNQVHTDLGDSLMMLADGPVVWIGNGSVSYDDVKARIDPKRMGFASQSQPSVYLLLRKYGWEVNLEQTYADGATAAQLTQMSASYAMYREIGQAMRDAAREVMGGKYHSIEEASQALGERLKAIKSDAAPG
jgi:hypothetical protein